MVMRKTPYERIRYPWTSDVVTAADVQAMASDIDQGLVETAALGFDFSHLSSVSVSRAAAQSITKATLTAITWDTVNLDNGSDSPLANGLWWAAANPTRLTAPSACIVLASAVGGINATTALGTSGAIQTTITLNGVTTGNNMQGAKFGPLSTDTGTLMPSALAMWSLAAGDYLELKTYWTGTPAGPFSTSTFSPPTMSLMMVGVPALLA